MSLPPRRHRNDAWHGESSQKMAENKSAAIFRWRWMVATRIVAPNLGVSWVMMGYSHDPFRTMVFSTFLTPSSDKGVPPAIWKAPICGYRDPPWNAMEWCFIAPTVSAKRREINSVWFRLIFCQEMPRDNSLRERGIQEKWCIPLQPRILGWTKIVFFT